MTTRFRAPSPPYVGPAARTSSGSNKPIRRITMHSTVSPCVPGGARTIGRYFASEKARGSAHYIVDPKEIVQSVFDGVIAWHAPPNGHSIGVEMCDYPDAYSAERWKDKPHREMLALAADLVADLCLAYGIPARFIGKYRLRLGWRGVTDHDEVSKAFGQSSHWDCGKWPKKAFMRAVRRRMTEKRQAANRTADRKKEIR